MGEAFEFSGLELATFSSLFRVERELAEEHSCTASPLLLGVIVGSLGT